ncbi:DedA family protein [Candidatus Woesearchaeota archaeon]|nr:DedA family protein [Candidatus Woesearchaeota archaeon]
MIQNFIEWAFRLFGHYGSFGLFFLAFIESSFFPIPPDLLLITLGLADPSKVFFYALICTIGSVSGGIFGYLIGSYGGRPILEKLFSKQKVDKVHNIFEKYEWWVIFLAGFTPMPYKLFTIGAGAFYIDFKKFVFASIFGRGSRFFLIAVLIYYFGEAIVIFLDNNFGIYTLLLGLTLLLCGLIFKKYKK